MNLEIIISISSVFIACMALFVAVWQGYATRKHNRLSIKPILHTSLDFSEGKVSLRVKNCGVGPAIIKTIQVNFHNELFDGSKIEWALKIGDEF